MCIRDRCTPFEELLIKWRLRQNEDSNFDSDKYFASPGRGKIFHAATKVFKLKHGGQRGVMIKVQRIEATNRIMVKIRLER